MTALETKIATSSPIGVISSAYLTAAEVSELFDGTGLGVVDTRMEGWAICNGNNGTPDVNGKFFRFNTTVAAGTGGNDSSAHTHTLSAHTHTGPSHTHTIAHTHDHAHTHDIDHNHAAEDCLPPDSTVQAAFGTDFYAADDIHVHSVDLSALGTTASGAASTATTGASSAANSGADGTGATGSPSSDITGAASATDNKPAYIEVVPIMRIS